MPINVPVVYQPRDSYSCVPSCVYAVLLAWRELEYGGEGSERDADEDRANSDDDIEVNSPDVHQEELEDIGEICEETEVGCDLIPPSLV